MTIYKCPRCCKIIDRKYDFERHLKKTKRECKVSKDGKDINLLDYYELWSNPINYIEIMELRKDLEELKQKVIILENKNKELKKKLDLPDKDKSNIINDISGTVNGDIINNNTTNNIQFIINAYNDPNTAYILSKHADAALKNGNLVEGCIQMARLIWFNGNHPENHSIFKTNQKNKNIKCLEDGKVNEYTLNSKFQSIMEVILMVFERAEKESERYYDLNDMFDNPDKHPEFYKRLENELSNELYNHKELVKETIAKLQQKRLS